MLAPFTQRNSCWIWYVQIRQSIVLVALFDTCQTQSSVRPHVSGPNDVKVMQSVEDMERKNVQIHKAYIVSCVNSRVQDLAAAAKVVKGTRLFVYTY
jgi:homoaconitase/3-isopropylmalate dehydratase large subunit